MKTVSVNIYKFNELSEEAKENALSKLSDINVGYEWWESVYQDAENVGLEISGFDTYRGDIYIEFVSSASETASGFNLWIGTNKEIEKGKHLGKKLSSVPDAIQWAVIDRMMN